ncbi:DUF222 domain-containing protein [Dietzia massiliensis]|uniref:DUF222 domain-containing protein n=1 Tax=Dietzia massiliensis TaxID=2697499 RepID=UPI001BD19638|nr:DUF222 domain-containing protein [Dietzia massiliensis]MBS7549345.1 DUF222 domain-containing protein [Dietzia massiliensis]
MCEDEQERRDLAAGYDPEIDLRPEHAVIDPFHIACAEIVAAYGVHNNRARTLLTRARTLITRFPTLVEAMETGRLDEDTATLLARHMRTVDSAHRGPVQREIIDWLMAAIAAGTRPGRDAILATLDRIITDHDPAGVRARRAAATRERHIRLRRGTDGMADLTAHLTATEASTLYEVLHRAATEQATRDKKARLQAARTGGDTVDAEYIRSIDELRADALVAAFLDPTDPDDAATAQDPKRAAARFGSWAVAASSGSVGSRKAATRASARSSSMLRMYSASTVSPPVRAAWRRAFLSRVACSVAARCRTS